MNKPFLKIRGNLVDIFNREIYPVKITMEEGKITKIKRSLLGGSGPYILPGFVDAHIHIESSLCAPSEFARMATTHGTVATVSDPHEIANVLGEAGIRMMVHNGSQVPFKFCFGVPSCVPATAFETAGGYLGPDEVDNLFEELGLTYLAEMMNYPGVLGGDPEVMEKIAIAKRRGLPIDGHAPGLMGEDLRRYAETGISTDHESFTLPEAEEKIACGMKVLIREGSAARNYDALHPLIGSAPDQVMFCSDDRHPDTLELSHIDDHVRRSVAHGYDLFDVLRCATLNPVEHYNLPVGLLREGDPADFIVVKNLTDFKVLQTYIDGRLVAEKGKPLIERVKIRALNHISTSPKKVEMFAIKGEENTEVRAIDAVDGQLVTGSSIKSAKVVDGYLHADPSTDLLKITVVNRYSDTPPAIAFIRGIGLKRGALASSVAHDSHNIVAVGTNDVDLTRAVNALIETKGGLVAVDGEEENLLPLPIAGLMSGGDAWRVAREYKEVDAAAKKMGTPLASPFMTLSFMALLVIPSLKLSDKGLFDGNQFTFVDLIPRQVTP